MCITAAAIWRRASHSTQARTWLEERAALAQLRLETPAFVFAGDRFIVRDWAEQNTLAGGIVLDPDASRRPFPSQLRAELLGQRARRPDEVLYFVASQVAHDGTVRRSQLLLKSRFSASAISDAVSHLAASGELVLAEDFVSDARSWQALRDRAADAIDAQHRAHPEQVGLSLTELRAVLKRQLPFPELFDAFVRDLSKSEFVRVGAAIRRAAHRPVLSAQLEAAGRRLRATLAAKPFDPPSRKELAPDPVLQQALQVLDRDSGGA